MPKVEGDTAQSNRLLGALEKGSRERIAAHLEPVTLKLGSVVCDAGGLLKHAYFPEGAVLSLLTVLENGSAIETDVVAQLREAYLQEMISFPWQRGDLLLLDNILTAHARTPFAGPRKILVAMAEPYTRSH